MIGAPLSRWTMSYFVAALVSLVAAEIMMASGYGFPADSVRAPETLVLVHVTAIGWLSLLMCGALFQFVPVLVAHPLFSNRLPLPAFFSLIAGLACLLLGFLTLAGSVAPILPFFAFAGLLLGIGFGLVIWNLGATLWSARPLPLHARFVAVGLASVAATVTFGIVFALVLQGVLRYTPFIDLTVSGVPLHAVLGLGGWLTFAAMGVSYRLLAMFMLAPETERTTTRAALHLGGLALAVTAIGGPASVWVTGTANPALAVAGVAGIAALGSYGFDIRHLYAARRRQKIELNTRMAVLSFASLAATVILVLGLQLSGRLAEHAGAIVFLATFGWLSGLGLSKLYKIVAFLTWLECYGPVLGKRPTPRVQELVVEQRALKWFVLYFVAVWSCTLALFVESPFLFQRTAVVMLVATLGIVAQLVRVRRLADVNTDQRPPEEAAKPSFFRSLAPQD